MRKKLPISTDDFQTIIDGGCYFVDKSMFIAEVLENMFETKLILRPRRFGKSLNMSMLKAFLEIGSPVGLFEGLAISGQKGLCAEHQGKHPVIYLSFKDMRANSFSQVLDLLASCVWEEAERLGISQYAPGLSNRDQLTLSRLDSPHATENDVAASIYLMAKMLNRSYGKKAVVLIDEYDAPINQAYQNEYYDDITRLFRNMLGKALKGNRYVSFAVMTGVLRISKDSIFSDLNNIRAYSALDERCSAHFGFTEGEVAAMLGYYGIEERMPEMKAFYDGYKIGSYEMYNPWSVVNACYDMLTDRISDLEKYWINTGSNDLVREMLMRDGFEALSSIEDLANGGTIKKSLSIFATYRDLIDTPSSEAVWDMMFMSGYLTWVKKAAKDKYELRAPNLEVREALRKDALSWAKSAMPINKGDADKLLMALLAGNAEGAEAVINDLFEKILSVKDGVVVHGDFKIDKERHYHLITSALLACSSWDVESEAESGDGYADIICTNETLDAAVIVEEKFSRSKGDKSLAKQAEEAIEQIVGTRYAKSVEGFSTVAAVGIAYESRRCKIAIRQLR